MTGKGNDEGLPLRGMDVVVVGERVGQYGRAVPESPLRCKSRRWGMTGKGTHEGLPLRGMDLVVVVERVRQFECGRFPNRLYGAK